MRLLLALALLLTATTAQAECRDGVCRLKLHAGQPVRNVVKAPIVAVGKVAKAAVVVPAKAIKGTATFFRERKPVRRFCRGMFRVATFRGPILTRMRAHRCH